MVSVASGGRADRIGARILFKVLRGGPGHRQGIHQRVSERRFLSPQNLRLPDFPFLMRAMLRELPLQIHVPDHRAAVRHDNCHSLF